MANRYLEKVAAMVPRAVARVAKEGVGALKDAVGVGARAAKAGRAEAFSQASNRGVKNLTEMAKTRAAALGPRGAQTDVQLGNLAKAKFKAEQVSNYAATRATRTAQAASLAQKGSRRVIGGSVAGAAAVGAAGAVAHKKD